jgi:O-antigen/teichoic acid export membrane protein
MHSLKTSIIKNILFGWGKNVILAILNLAIVPMLIASTGKEGYGIFGILASFILLLMFIDAGVSTALDKVFSEYFTQKKHELINKALTTLMFVDILIIVLISIALFYLSSYLIQFFNISSSFYSEVDLLFKVYTPVLLGCSLIVALFTSYLRCLNRYDLENSYISGSQIIKCIAIIFLYQNEMLTLISYAFVDVITKAILIPILWNRCVKLNINFDISLKYFDLKSLIPIYYLGFKFLFLKLIGLFRSQSDPFILTSYLGPSSISIYKPALSLVASFRPFATILSDQVLPLLARFNVEKDFQKEILILVRGTRFTMLLGVPFLITLFSLKNTIIWLWLGDSIGNSLDGMIDVLVLLCLIDFIIYMGGTQFPFFIAKNKLKFLTWYVEGPVAIINFSLSVFLVVYFDMGVKGVVIGTLMGAIITNPILTIYSLRLAKIKLWYFIKIAYLPSFIIAALCYTNLYIGNEVFDLEANRSIFSLILGISISLITWLIGVVIISDKYEKEIFKKLYLKVKGKR